MMVQDERLQAYLPHTSKYSPDMLWEYLERYPTVMLKPSGGGGGAGVIQLSRYEEEEREKFRVHTGNKVQEFKERNQLLSYVTSLFIPKPYILQPRIPLATIQGRPFDLRVMVQRKKGLPWKVTGMLAKVAGRGFVVTNIRRSKGKVLPIEQAILNSNVKKTDGIIPQLKQIALNTADRLEQFYPDKMMIGIDMGIDINGKPWIIEANFRPAVSLFEQLEDKTIYNRIRSYLRK